MASNRANLQTIISADASQFSATMRRAQTMASRTGAGIGRSISSASSAIAGLGAVAAKATLKIAAVGAGLASAAVAASFFKGVKLAADIEQMAISFEVMTGSADEGKRVLEEIRKLGAATPFEFPELADAGRKLIAFGINAKDVTETLSRIGDVSSGVGAPISEIADAYGKARVQGTLFAEDLDMFTGRGIPILDDLGAQLGVAAGEVRKMASEGKITFPMLEQSFRNLTGEGGTFFGMTARQSTTFNGRMSTMIDSINNALANMGTPLIATFMPYIEKATLAIDRMGPSFIKMGEQVGRVIDGFLEKETIGGALSVLSAGMIGTLKLAGVVAAEYLIKGFAAALAFLKNAFENVTVMDMGKALWETFLRIFFELGDAVYDAITGGVTESLEGAGSTLEDSINSALGGIDWGLSEESKEAAERWKALFNDLFPEVNPPAPSASTSESDLYDKESEDQKRRVMADEAAAAAAKSGAFPAFGTDYGPRDPFEQAGPSKSLINKDVAASAAKSTELAGSGFSGLSELARMQADKARGFEVGSGSSLSLSNQKNPGGAFGRSSGLQTGSLGAKRKVGGDKESKKTETLQEKQASSLESIDGKLTQALTVG